MSKEWQITDGPAQVLEWIPQEMKNRVSLKVRSTERICDAIAQNRSKGQLMEREKRGLGIRRCQ
jgi:hypothetical protein